MNKNDIYKKIDDGIGKWEESWISTENPWVVIGVLFCFLVVPFSIITSTLMKLDMTASYALMGIVTVLMICFVFWTFRKLRYKMSYKSADIDEERRLAIIEKKLMWIKILSWGYLVTGTLLFWALVQI